VLFRSLTAILGTDLPVFLGVGIKQIESQFKISVVCERRRPVRLRQPRRSKLAPTPLNNGPIPGIFRVRPAARYSKSVVAGPKSLTWPSDSILADEATAEP
jgi:hypothetical protein